MADKYRRHRRRWPICSATGKQRLGERKDVHLVLKVARRCRAQAEIEGAEAVWTVVRGYRCTECDGGWHLTSVPLRVARTCRDRH